MAFLVFLYWDGVLGVFGIWDMSWSIWDGVSGILMNLVSGICYLHEVFFLLFQKRVVYPKKY